MGINMASYLRNLALVNYFKPPFGHYEIILRMHEDRTRHAGGRFYRDDPARLPLKATIVPLDENLKLILEGETQLGLHELYVDCDHLYDTYGVTIDIVQDHIEEGNKLLKILKQQDYDIYTNIASFIISKLPDEFADD